jgi:hypothetical protein
VKGFVFMLDAIDRVEHSGLHNGSYASAHDWIRPARRHGSQHDFVPVRDNVVGAKCTRHRENKNGEHYCSAHRSTFQSLRG